MEWAKKWRSFSCNSLTLRWAWVPFHYWSTYWDWKLGWTRHCTGARHDQDEWERVFSQAGKINRQKKWLQCGKCYWLITLFIKGVGIRGKRKLLGVLEGNSYKRGHLTCVSKDNLKFPKDERQYRDCWQREDHEQRHRGMKKMALFIKGFKRWDDTFSTAWGLIGVELISWDKCNCVNPNWSSTAQEKRKAGE